MTFGKYISSCRKRLNFSQIKLVEKLFVYDPLFKSLDTTALSRWELDKVIPSIERQLRIIHFFGQYQSEVFPCVNKSLLDELKKKLITKENMLNFFGQSQAHIQNIPVEPFQFSEVNIKKLIDSNLAKEKTITAEFIMRSLTKDVHKITANDLYTAAFHPSNIFLSAEYNNQSVGMFFSIQVTHEAFEKIMNFELPFHKITEKDLVSIDEEGCNILLNLFAFNDKIATLLFAEYLTILLNNQSTILKVGAIAARDSGRKMAKNIGLTQNKKKTVDNIELTSHWAPSNNLLIRKDILHVLFDTPNGKKS